MRLDSGLIKHVLLFAVIMISFITISNFFMKRDKAEESTNEETIDINAEETVVRDIAMYNTAIDDDLFEVIQTSNVSNKFVSYVIADKKTGLCYLVMQNESSMSMIEYKNHLGEQFSIMSYPSYNSPYEEYIKDVRIGE